MAYFFGIGIGQPTSSVTGQATTTSKDVELVINTNANVTSNQQIFAATEYLKQALLEIPWPASSPYFYGVNAGAQRPTVTSGASTTSKDVELVIRANPSSIAQTVIALENIKDFMLQNPYFQ